MLRGHCYGPEPVDRGGVDSGVVQVVPVSRCLDEEFRSWSVRQRGITQALSIIVSCVVTNGVGCDVTRLLSGSNQSIWFLLRQKSVGRQCRYQPLNHPTELRRGWAE